MGATHDKALTPTILHQPSTLQQAWELKAALGDRALYVSGGTLLRTQWEAGTLSIPEQVIDLRAIEEMGGIRRAEFHLSLGALVSLSQCRKDQFLQAAAPAVQEAARLIAAPAVRNLATLGGNLASGFGDILPALLIYDTELTTFDGRFMNSQQLTEWLSCRWGGVNPRDDIIAEIRIPCSPEVEILDSGKLEVFRKVGRREAFTPSLVTVAMKASINDGLVLSDVRIAAGGGSGRPQRLAAVEALLEGLVYEERILASVYEAAVNEFESYSDHFATEDYKKKTAGNLIVAELWKAMNSRSTTGEE